MYGFVENDAVNNRDAVGLTKEQKTFGPFAALYKDFSRGRILDDQSYMKFTARCPVGCKLMFSKIDEEKLGNALIDALDKKLIKRRAELSQAMNRPYNPFETGQVGVRGALEESVKNLQSEIDRIRSNPAAVTGERKPVNVNCKGDAFILEYFMNTRFSAGFPATLSSKYVADLVDVYIANSNVSYWCEKCD